MGRPLIPPENLRVSFKVRAQRKIVDELTREATVEQITRQRLIENILVDHVEKRRRRTAASSQKADKTGQKRRRRTSPARF